MSEPIQFKTLPTELRLKIWQLAFPTAKIVHIKNWKTDPWHSMIKGFFSPPETAHPPSPLLATCSEARTEYLYSHKLLCEPWEEAASDIGTFFDQKSDVLLLDLSWVSFQINHPCMDLLAPKAVLDGVRFLAMDFVTADGGGLGYLLMRNPLKLFGFFQLFAGLEEFVFIIGREVPCPGAKGESTQLIDIEKESEMKQTSEKILERIERSFRDCEGHNLKALPKIRIQTVKGGNFRRLCAGQV